MQYYLYLLLLVSLACPSRGATIFSDFDPANIAYQGGWGIYGTGNSLSPGAFKAQAMAFTPSFDAVLSKIDVAMFWSSGTNSIKLTLNSDNSGVPGAVVASWSLNNLPTFGFCCTAETVNAVSLISLTAGKQYWVVAAPGASDTQAGWTNTNTLGVLAEQDTLNGPFISGTSVRSAFDVIGTETPEPSSFLLVAAGLALLARRNASS